MQAGVFGEGFGKTSIKMREEETEFCSIFYIWVYKCFCICYSNAMLVQKGTSAIFLV